MKPKSPAGGDMPPGFRRQQPFTEKPSAALRKTNVDIARHNLQVKLKKYKEASFRAAKKMAAENVKQARQADEFVRKVYADEPRKMAEWQEVMKRWEDSELNESEVNAAG